MTEPVRRLQAFIAANPDVSVFAPGVSPDAVAAAEAEIGAALPNDYKAFLTQFDGGFISLGGAKSDANWDEDRARYGSIWLFGLSKMVEEFHEQEDIWTLDHDWQGRWPYVPFCLVAGHELLTFSAPDESGERSVVDAWHEWGPERWKVLQPSFGDFLDELVAGAGRAETIARSG
jgi:hypothetical protein